MICGCHVVYGANGACREGGGRKIETGQMNRTRDRGETGSYLVRIPKRS